MLYRRGGNERQKVVLVGQAPVLFVGGNILNILNSPINCSFICGSVSAEVQKGKKGPVSALH